MPIRLIVARTSKEIDQVFLLRHRVFVEEERRFDLPEARLFDHFDCLAETLNLLALDGETPVASLRVTLENEVGLPCFEHYDFTQIMKNFQGKCGCFGWLCCLQKYRHHAGMVAGLVKLGVRKSRQGGNRHILVTAHPPIVPILAGFGMVPVGEPFQAGTLKVPMQPMYADLDNLASGKHELYADPLNQIMDESDERRIYARDEVITRKGEIGDCAYLIMRGSVRVVLEAAGSTPAEKGPAAPPGAGPKDLLFGQGHVFGEISLFDGGPRTSTVVAHSKEVDVMVWSRSEFLRQIRSDPERTLKLLHILASRLRRNIEGAMQNPPASLLASILLDASRKGELPVNIEWLSRQCGMWIGDLELTVAAWCEYGWVAKADKELRVLKPAQLTSVTTL